MKSIEPYQITFKEYKILFNTYYNPLCNFANKYLNDYEACKDVVQEVFIKIWDKQIGLTSENAIRSYLYTSVKNKSLDFLKSNAYKKIRSISDIEIKKLESEPYFTREAILEESSRLIQEAVNTLPFKCKQIIDLSLNGYKNDEISKELSISINTVKAQKRIAYGKLRVILKGAFVLIAHIFTDI
ncbi:RNA polymerase sigma-70 factor [Galbibacter sp. PAP.153]|uniref:RNA polymerase sigma-70 factor n=1 Tax=Galbibacter sp. PAP.153 TaxID=3104623 RepID=UPI0030097E10